MLKSVIVARNRVSHRIPLIRLLSVFLILSLLLIPGATFAASGVAPRSTTNIQILDISDWHGQLDPQNIGGVDIGGAAVLSAYFQTDRAANPNTLTLTAGDAVGATPPLSNYFNDEPAILAMNLMGIQVDTFGNHNFDGGIAHLQDLINLADFQFVSANLQNRDNNLTGVKDFQIFNVGGVKIGIVGITNPEAPTLVFPGSFGTITPTDPVKAALKARNAAKDAGAEIVVVICHLGVTSFDLSGAPAGPLIDFAKAVNKNGVKVDLIIGDHTDVQYKGIINGALVLENKSKGVTYAKINLSVDAASHKILSQSATFVVPVASAVTPDPAIVSMLAPYRTQLSQIFDTPIAVATALFPRAGTPSVERSGESALGDLIADSLRLKYGTQLALTNGGGIRASLPSSYAPADHTLRRTSAGYAAGPPYDIVIGDVFAVLPFGNTVVTRTVTGTQLWAALENGVSQISSSTCTGADGRFPQISGFKFTFQCSNPVGSRVLSVSLTDGTPIPADSTTYTFVTNNFVNAGGDFYSVLNDGQGTTRENMFDVTLEYIQSLGTITPTLDGRITKVP